MNKTRSLTNQVTEKHFSTELCCSVPCGYKESPWRTKKAKREKQKKKWVLFPGHIIKGGPSFFRVNSILQGNILRARKLEKQLQQFCFNCWNRCFMSSTHQETSVCVNTGYPREFCQVTSAIFCPRKESKRLLVTWVLWAAETCLSCAAAVS